MHHIAYFSRDFIDGATSQAALSRALPPPSYGDIFFDLEGHPFAESESGGGGIESREYLWGASTVLSPSGKQPKNRPTNQRHHQHERRYHHQHQR